MSMKPPAPTWLNRVGFIMGYIWQGCDVPFQLYVQLSAAPIGEAALILVGLDMQDIVKEFFRPAGLRSARHGRKSRKGSKVNVSIPDPSEMVAHNMPAYQEIRGRPFGSPTFWLFELTDVADRVVWNMAVVDIVTDIGYKTLYGIISENNDNCPNIARMYRTMEFDYVFYSNNLVGTTINIIEFARGNINSTIVGAFIFEPGYYSVTMEMTFYNPFDNPTEIGIGIGNADTAEIIVSAGPVWLAKGEVHTMQVDCIVHANININWMAMARPFSCYSFDKKVLIMQLA